MAKVKGVKRKTNRQTIRAHWPQHLTCSYQEMNKFEFTSTLHKDACTCTKTDNIHKTDQRQTSIRNS